jgi:hypothetical protein
MNNPSTSSVRLRIKWRLAILLSLVGLLSVIAMYEVTFRYCTATWGEVDLDSKPPRLYFSEDLMIGFPLMRTIFAPRTCLRLGKVSLSSGTGAYMDGGTFYRRLPDGTYKDLTDGFRRHQKEIALSPRFAKVDIKDLSMIVNKLRRQSDPVSTFIWQSLSSPEQALLTNYQPSESNNDEARRIVVSALNNMIGGSELYEITRFQDVVLRPETGDLLRLSSFASILPRLNRMLLEDAYPVELKRNP